MQEVTYREMEYDRCIKFAVLAEGVWASGSGSRYAGCILSYGSHPCAYVQLPESHPYYGQTDYDAIPVDCHGGLTYAAFGLHPEKYKKDGFWVGWDYLHWGDFADYGKVKMPGKQWTVKEIQAEVESVVQQLVALETATPLDKSENVGYCEERR